MIKAEIICDSVNPVGCRLTTFLVKYPRFCHAEVMRHRSLSFCVASSRAIPFRRQLQSVWADYARPIEWGENKPGMQAGASLPRHRQVLAEAVWRLSSLIAICLAWLLARLNVHKQHVNRILEPYLFTEHIIQGTDFGNFFNLRCSPQAQPEFRRLATLMLREYAKSVPAKLEVGDFHLPFAGKFAEGLSIEDKIKVSTARCARVSYSNHDGSFSLSKDIQLYEKLISSGHFSPTEFPCAALSTNERIGNLCGWKQHRKTLKNENQEVFDINKLLISMLD